MVTTTAVWEINNKHFSELIGLFMGNLQVTTVVNQISQDVDYCILKYQMPRRLLVIFAKDRLFNDGY